MFQLFEVHVWRHLISFGCFSRETESDMPPPPPTPLGYLLMVTAATAKQPTRSGCEIVRFRSRAPLTAAVSLSRQTDVMHQSVFEMIHTEDQQEFRRNLRWAPDPSADTAAEPQTGGWDRPGAGTNVGPGGEGDL